MLHAEQVGQFLLHENPYVRDHALRSLWLAEGHAGVSAELALDAIDKYGLAAFAKSERISHLPMSEKAMARLLSAAAEDAATIADILSAQPQAIITRHAAKFPEELRDLLSRRIELGTQPPEKLWSQLDPGSESDVVQLALVEHDEFVAGRVTAILSRRDDPLERIAIELAGRCHLGTALPQLLDRFAAGGEITELAIEAVARLGTAGAVTAIEQRCARGDAAFRVASSDCLACIRVPSAEPVLQRLLIEEDDPQAMASIVSALADICTTTNFEVACQRARSGLNLGASERRALAALSIMLNRPLSERDAWLTGRPQGDDSLPRALGVRTNEQPAPQVSYGFSSFADVPGPTEPAKPAPIRRQVAKVGRNDPCPCGSGRKYKKCCGA